MLTPGAGSGSGSAARPPLDVVAWVCLQDGLLLHVRTRGNSAFYVPGGKREPGESDAEALLREVREELGVLLDPATLRLAATVEAPAHGVHEGRQVRMLCFFASPLPSSPPPAPASEIAELRWLALSDGPITAPADIQLMELLVAQGLLAASRAV
ncbi:ADP-ribose pyrophosphatase YjhB, NUDIX family [Frankineae bacterium MT45]|nr:ADP-ribose pyrophosphatase YjhB, NUDIX family [Frankineae bacterium MT45]